MRAVASVMRVRARGGRTVRRPLTDAAFSPVLVDAEHSYVAPVPGFFVGALLTDYTADGSGRVIRFATGVGLNRVNVERIVDGEIMTWLIRNEAHQEGEMWPVRGGGESLSCRRKR